MGCWHLRDEAALFASFISWKRLGRAIAEKIIAEARTIGYQRMRLDTIEPIMKDAVEMYRKLGFRQIAPYRPNPIAGAMYMELQL
jgi:putative acetyltransferase